MQQKQPFEELVLKISKEIAVKFIEMGRITPANFDATFRNIYQTILTTTQIKQEATTQGASDDNS